MQKQHTWLRTLHSEATAVVQTIDRNSKYIITLYLLPTRGFIILFWRLSMKTTSRLSSKIILILRGITSKFELTVLDTKS